MKYIGTRSKAVVGIPLGLACYDLNGFRCNFLGQPISMGAVDPQEVNLYHCGYFNKSWLAIEINPLKCIECLNKYRTD